MSERKNFELTGLHLRLLARMYVSWDDTEFGAPAINPKRPYGNSDVLGDMREILEPEIARHEDESNEYPGSAWTDRALRDLHKQTRTALQIVLAVPDARPGLYEAGPYHEDWTLVKGEL